MLNLCSYNSGYEFHSLRSLHPNYPPVGRITSHISKTLYEIWREYFVRFRGIKGGTMKAAMLLLPMLCGLCCSLTSNVVNARSGIRNYKNYFKDLYKN